MSCPPTKKAIATRCRNRTTSIASTGRILPTRAAALRSARQARVLEVDVALDPAHAVAVDLAALVELEELVALRPQELAAQAHVRLRPAGLAVPVAVGVLDLRLAVLVRAADPIEHLVGHPVLGGQVLGTCERRVQRLPARLGLAAA